MSIKATGFKMKLSVSEQQLRGALNQQAKAGLVKVGMMAEGYAKQNITEQKAVDTGNLRNSLTHTVEDLTVMIGTNVHYGPYIELGTGPYSSVGGGTSKPSWIYQAEDGTWHKAFPQKPRPYLKPAMTDHMDEYHDVLEKALKGIL